MAYGAVQQGHCPADIAMPPPWHVTPTVDDRLLNRCTSVTDFYGPTHLTDGLENRHLDNEWMSKSLFLMKFF
jgi:hypothetical protein